MDLVTCRPGGGHPRSLDPETTIIGDRRISQITLQLFLRPGANPIFELDGCAREGVLIPKPVLEVSEVGALEPSIGEEKESRWCSGDLRGIKDPDRPSPTPRVRPASLTVFDKTVHQARHQPRPVGLDRGLEER